MAHVIENDACNINHPCYGMSCNDCETCIFDKDIFDKDAYIKINKTEMDISETCHVCGYLIKNYIGDERMKYNACCGRSLIDFNGYSRPRIIKANVEGMTALFPPDWCPKKNGITTVHTNAASLSKELTQKYLPPIPSTQSPTVVERKQTQVTPATPSTPVVTTPRKLTFYEKKTKLMEFPKHLTWDEIKEDEVYVIPRILTQPRKVVRILVKTDSLIRCCEIDEYGEESSVMISLFPNDIDLVFITKILKY